MNTINIDSKFFFNIKIKANFLNGGRYELMNRSFSGFLARDKDSLADYISRHKNDFKDFIKRKRRPKCDRLWIRKSDNYDFISSLNVGSIYRQNWHSAGIELDGEKIFFTDCGIMTGEGWLEKNLELTI